MPRGRSWTDEEDKSLCLAWCAASEDAINGADQKSDTLWTTIQRKFSDLEPTTKRSLSAIKSRWVDINREVGRFAGCVSLVENLNESGKTEADKMCDALKMYEAKHGEAFAFVAAYEVLSTKDKWKPSPTKKRPATDPPHAAGGPSDGESSSKRPTGSKAATTAAKESKLRQLQYKTSASIAKSMARRNEILNEMASIELFNQPDTDPMQRLQFFHALRQRKLAEVLGLVNDSDTMQSNVRNESPPEQQQQQQQLGSQPQLESEQSTDQENDSTLETVV